jgi:hypothetical protein
MKLRRHGNVAVPLDLLTAKLRHRDGRSKNGLSPVRGIGHLVDKVQIKIGSEHAPEPIGYLRRAGPS